MKKHGKIIEIVKANYRLAILLLFSMFVGLLTLVWDSLAFSCLITALQHLVFPIVGVKLFIGNRDVNLENRLISGVSIGSILGLTSATSLLIIENVRSPILDTATFSSEFTLLIYVSYVVLFTCVSIFFSVIGAISIRPKSNQQFNKLI